MLNPNLMSQLETYGLTDDHLAQLLAICHLGEGRATWHIGKGYLTKVEVALFASQRDSRGMRHLTDLLQKER